ncbi:MAG: chemotaxis protein CheA [Clostridiales bacterium]|nr:chemotaxis protein CheA [Clostridiales bacterium]MCF8021769.1 chemotaxis protein CheA [Clostridiales bacterium]
MFTDDEISVFMEELDEKIQVINDNVLELEKEGGKPEILQEIFRAAHTIKGSSALMGYEKMSALTHEIENLFDRLRQNTMEINVYLVDLLFEAMDTINALRDEITGKGDEVDIGPVVKKMRKIQESEQQTQAEDVPQPFPGENDENKEAPQENINIAEKELPEVEKIDASLIRAAQVKGLNAYWVITVLEPGTQMKEVRAYLVFENLQQYGEIIKSDPPAEDIQENKFENYFTVLVLTENDQEYIKNLVFSVAEVKDVHVDAVEIPESLAAEIQEENRNENAGSGKEQPGNDKEQVSANEKKSNGSKTVRVDVDKLDNLMNLVGELVIDRTRLDRFVTDFEEYYGSDMLAENIMEISKHLGQVSGNLQDEIMKARMLPIAHVFNRLPRFVRDISHKMNKEVDFNIDGKETELDRNVIEVLGDPLIHLLRNAIDHGIETPEERIKAGKPRAGKLDLKAAYVESQIIITMQDDGKGMDPSKVRQRIYSRNLVTKDQLERLGDKEVLEYIFKPGFSTSENVSDISGRGVGMDVVRSQIEQINGAVYFDTVHGEGTTFTIKLPLTLAIIRSLMVSLGEHTYAFPLNNISETLAINSGDIELVRHSEVVVIRGSVLPLVRLANIFNQEPGESQKDKMYVVVLSIGDKKVGVVVDSLVGEQEIVIKSMGSYFGQIEGLSGATILGDGKVALIVDARGIIKKASAASPEETVYAEAN